MTKGSKHRHARAEGSRQVEAADRLLRAGKNAEALRLLLEASRLTPDGPLVLARLGLAYVTTGRGQQAIEVLRRSLAKRPNVGEVHYHLAIALQGVGDENGAVDAYREAVHLSPELADAHGRLGSLLYQKGLRSEAVPEFEKAAALLPGTPQASIHRAMAHMAMDRMAEAEDELRREIARDASNSGAFHLLGWILQVNGKLTEAVDVFERAIQNDPVNAYAYQGLVNSRKFTEADHPWIQKMLSQLEKSEGPAVMGPVEGRRRMTFHFALGKVLNDLGNYAEAMTHFDAANQIRRWLLPFNREGMERRIERLTTRYTPEFLAKNRALGSDDRTPILIAGLPRSGTSLLERMISNHPEVRGCGELDFWNENGRIWAFAEPAALARVSGELQRDYLGLLRQGAPHVARATDKMPFNFYWLGFIHLIFPNAVIVHCRRNPVDTCLSIYMTQFSVEWDFASALGDLADYHRLYRRLMDHWRAILPPNRLLEVDYEDIVAEPEKAARSLLAFCGLPWSAACVHPEANPRAVATASHWQARQPIYTTSVERWRRYEPWIRELRELIPPDVA
jgi:tetratricopeptide (TPR) repeat protein